MIKLAIRRARLVVLVAILVGSIFGSFHNSITMADDGGEGGPIIFDYGDGGSGTVECVTIPAGCTSYGCNGNPGQYKCSLSVQQAGAICTSGGACRVR
jgi:hypothetical protein